MSNGKEQLEHLGVKLIKTFYQTISAVRIHQDNNQLIKDSAAQLYGTITEAAQGGHLVIQVWRGRFHIQGEKLLYRRETYHIINELAQYFGQRGLGGMAFHASFAKASPEDLVAVIRMINDSVRNEDPPTWLEIKLAGNGFTWVEVTRKQEETSSEHEIRRKEKARKTYIHALNTVKEVAEKASKGITGVRKTRRVAQNIVDLVQEDSSLLLGLATIRDYDDYTYTHSVNVALLATCLGKFIGLSNVYLEYLTVCALFHDLGKVGVSKEILLKQGELSAAEWSVMKSHPLIGVRKILRLHAPHSLRSRIILGPFEHHLNPDMTGYPKTRYMKKLSLLGKILKIADVYEALTAERAYRPRAFTPDEALRRMWNEAGKSFDRLLLKSFVNLMGLYPVGSLVELDSGELGLVMDYPDESEKALPMVLLLVEGEEGNIVPGNLVNLAVQDLDDPFTRRTIVRGVHASKVGIEPSRFFLQETGAAPAL